MLKKIYPVTCHTDHVGKNSTYVAIKGFSTDGNKFIPKAIDLGATKIVTEDKNPDIINLCKLKNIEYIQVKDTRKALATLSAKALKTNKLNLKIIAITGTKGKTSTTYIIDYILGQNKYKTALIGTIVNKILDNQILSTNTTPESDFLHMFLAECENQKIDFLIMEVSSHALSLNRTYGLKFDAIGFTNLAHEHLDFYKTIENYFKAKQKIFKQLKKNSYAVINTDNIWGKKAFEKFKNKLNINKLSSKNFDLIKKIVPKHMPGKFNLYNFYMSYLICKNLGLDDKKILNAIKTFPGVPGRLQMHVLKNKSHAFVDYAHNPSSMEEVLKTLRPLTKNLITVFGCGGNRDTEKRPIMGNIAVKYSDHVIITDDNPRFEDSKEIINQILTGIDKKDFKKITVLENRSEAISYAVKISNKNSIIAILGKGHENYHLVKGEKFHFDDFEEIQKY
ncbi:UDP-N-acetylmuramoyl-L-alanyl-D-glutamate--2,6-diaminopimelate ligase [Candidatus Dependentiae bacterium]|nr:UDP-N-acetylmuramoyl-L-alanyl-D-glutamate--2,6-diaminopimelate ligase [Candidatus Dependentiae bacterium]